MMAKVQYLGATDEQVNWGANDDPRGLLTLNEWYELDHLEEHTWHTKVYLKDFPGLKFNSVSFRGHWKELAAKRAQPR